MRILKFGIIAILLFMTSCVDDFYISNDKGVVINIQKDVDCNQVTIMIINDSV